MTGFLEAVIPSIGVGLIFYLAMRFIIRADRNERNAIEALERKHAKVSPADDPVISGTDSPNAPRAL
jgi:hypothetical protein